MIDTDLKALVDRILAHPLVSHAEWVWTRVSPPSATLSLRLTPEAEGRIPELAAVVRGELKNVPGYVGVTVKWRFS